MRAALLAALLVCTVRISVSRRYGPSIDKATMQKELDINRAKWSEAGIRSYELKQSAYFVGCPPTPGPVDITVLNGNISDVAFSQESTHIGVPNVNYGLLTVEGAFLQVQATLNHARTVAGLAVTYNATLGYVTSLSIDRNVKVIDDERRFNFELLRIISSSHGADGQNVVKDKKTATVVLPSPVLLPTLEIAPSPCQVTPVQRPNAVETNPTLDKIALLKINR